MKQATGYRLQATDYRLQTTDNKTLVFILSEAAAVNITLYDMKGALLGSGKVEVPAGISQTALSKVFNLSLASGNYVLRSVSNQNNCSVKVFIP